MRDVEENVCVCVLTCGTCNIKKCYNCIQLFDVPSFASRKMREDNKSVCVRIYG